MDISKGLKAKDAYEMGKALAEGLKASEIAYKLGYSIFEAAEVLSRATKALNTSLVSTHNN